MCVTKLSLMMFYGKAVFEDNFARKKLSFFLSSEKFQN